MVREETTLSSEAFRSKYAVPLSPLVPQTPPPPPALGGVVSPGPRLATATAGRSGASAFQFGPQPLPAPPPPGYLEGRRRRRQKGGVLVLARPRRLEREQRDEPATPEDDQQPTRARATSGSGKSELGWRGRLRESFRGGSRPRTAPQRASLPPTDSLYDVHE